MKQAGCYEALDARRAEYDASLRDFMREQVKPSRRAGGAIGPEPWQAAQGRFMRAVNAWDAALVSGVIVECGK